MALDARSAAVILALAGLALAGLALLGGQDGGGDSAVTSTPGEASTPGQPQPGDPLLCDARSDLLLVDDPDDGDTIYDVLLVILLDPYTLCDIVSIDLVVDYVPGRPVSADTSGSWLVVEIVDAATGGDLISWRREVAVTEPAVIINIPDSWDGTEILVTAYLYSEKPRWTPAEAPTG